LEISRVLPNSLANYIKLATRQDWLTNLEAFGHQYYLYNNIDFDGTDPHDYYLEIKFLQSHPKHKILIYIKI